MNATARVMAANSVLGERRNISLIAHINFKVILIIAAILLSAFGVIYLKDHNRLLFIEHQELKQQQQRYEVQWGKLMLERSTWASQARIQAEAYKLGMVIPRTKAIVMVNVERHHVGD